MEITTLATRETTSTNIYKDLEADKLVALLVAGSTLPDASRKEMPILRDQVNVPIEVNHEIQGYDPSSNYFEVVESNHQLPEQHITRLEGHPILNQADNSANTETTQVVLTTDTTATPRTTNITLHTRAFRVPRVPYTCSYCGEQYPNISAHRDHVIRHEGAQLSCPTCGKLVKRKSDLTRHMKLHVDSWVCNGKTDGPCGEEGCGKSFTRRDAMVRHWNLIKKKLEQSG